MNAALNLLSLVLAVGVPALIALWLPKRWRVAALILWILSPAAVLLALGLIEVASNPIRNDLDKVVYALLLIGSFLAVPWLLACLAGFATGTALRNRRQAPAVVAAPPAPIQTPPAPSPRPAGPDGNAFSLVPADAHEGRSTDGSLRYTHSDGELTGGRRDAVAPTATLSDAKTGTLLFDGRDWTDSRIVPQRDGSLLLLLEQDGRQTLFHIDPARGGFRDFARPGMDRPLVDLAEAAAEAHRESLGVDNRYIARRMAPDGSVMVELEAMEWMNGYWVHPPRVTELPTGRRVIDLWRTDWDATVEFPRDGVVRLSLYSYRRGAHMAVEIDLATDRYAVEDSTETGPVAELETQLKWAVVNVPGSADRFLPPAKPRTTARQWGVAFLILAGALVAIGAATFVTLRLGPERPPVRLDRIPAMPLPLQGGRSQGAGPPG